MINYKSLILGAGLAGVAVSGSFAADLPLAEPVEYVKVCDTYGKGYFYIPGTDTCLKVGGLVRMDLRFEQDDADEADDNFITDVRARIQFDARSETEWGTLRSFIEFEGRSDGLQGGYDDGASATTVRQAFVQFAGITAGRLSRSLYDFVQQKSIGDFFSDEGVNTLAYTASFGGGFDATIGIEDKYFRAMPFDETLDQSWPNVIAALAVKQAWGDVKISAAIQDNAGDLEDIFVGFDQEDEIGWAVQAGVGINLPGGAKGSKVWVQGAYTEGALSYIGGEELPSLRNFDLQDDLFDQEINADGALENVSAFSVGGGIAWFWNERWNSHLSAIYYDFDRPTAGDLSYLFVEASTFWSPVSNLDLGLALQYGSLDGDDLDLTDDEEDQFAVVGRIARTF
ncbi:porin [Terrihabitans sp. B22-R8]|uniref:porin n=1 Tax=Terrihabitans sp. B22-R8 TaxID=3425128 RepID=UPI00403CE9BD